MASVVAGGLQSLFAAISFSAAGLLFKHLDSNRYEAEMERHNEALETLSKAKEKFYENEVLKHDKIQQLRQQLSDANQDIEETNKSLDLLRQVKTIEFQGVKYDREPELSDFYKESPEMKEYQYLVMTAIGIGAGYLAYKVV